MDINLEYYKMRIIANITYFLLFLVLVIITMFLGGVSGVAGTFYLMVLPGDIESNLTTALTALIVLWFLLVLLRRHNKKMVKLNEVLEHEDD